MDLLHVALIFLLAAALTSVAAERLRLPYTIALVIAGFLAGRLHVFPAIAITPQGLLTLLILPLLFEGALHLTIADLRTYGLLIGLLAVLGTLTAALIIGGAAMILWHLPLRTAVFLGAIASAIDPVSVIALVRETRLNPWLGTILEAEAVLNDAVAIVLFTLAATPTPGGFLPALGQFVWLLVAGGVVGAGLGLVTCVALGRIHQHLTETLGSLILAVTSFVAADAVGGSGVIAVVFAGVALGNYGPSNLTEAGRRTLSTLWEVISFLANSVLFLLIGLAVPWKPLVDLAGLIGIVIVAALAARALAVYGFSALAERVTTPIPTSWQHLLIWGGLRGGVAIALVLQLAPGLPARHEIASAIYGLVVFTLLGQGLSMRAVMRRVGLLRDAPPSSRDSVIP